jgi:ribonuclease P protein component
LLSKINRLRKRSDFDWVFKRGLKFKEDFLSLRVVNNNLKNSRFGFIVSQKISKKATLRNKIKRRLRTIIRVRLKKIKKGLDIILITNPGLEKKDFWELEEILYRLFKKANLFQK